MNESTEVTLDQVEACLELFKAAKSLIEELRNYDSYCMDDLRIAIRHVGEEWDW